MRAALRAIGWVIRELIPAQAVRAAMNRDYHRVLAEKEVWQHRAEVLRDALVEFEAENEVYEGQCKWCGDAASGSHLCLRFASADPENPADVRPTPVESPSPLTPGVGHSRSEK